MNEILIIFICFTDQIILANMPMMGNPQQIGMTNETQKSLGVPPDMMMSFPFSMNLPSQGKQI